LKQIASFHCSIRNTKLTKI